MEKYLGEVEVDGTEWIWRAVTMAQGKGANPFNNPDSVFLRFESPDDPNQYLDLRRPVDAPESGRLSDARLQTLAPPGARAGVAD